MRVAVQTKKGEFAFECGDNEAILHAGLREGVSLPYECATGTCGTCRARVMSGEVDIGWQDAPGLANLKREKGDVLMCQTLPRTDCLLRVPSNMDAVSDVLPAARRGVIRSLRRLTDDVVHFELSLSSPMRFEAGQFVILQSPKLTGARAYSMVNFHPEADRLAFVIKRKPGGGFSDWLFDEATEDIELALFGPLGRAVFRVEEDCNILCIAGGSGIAGMMAILERATKSGYFGAHWGKVFFGVRTLADCFYLDELAEYVAAARGRLDVTVALSHENASSPRHQRVSSIGLASGFVHEVAAHATTGPGDGVIAYVAGPPPMVDGALRMLIAKAGLSPRQIRYDKFS
jgi:toluene monooxygenase electron transfer component